MLIEMKVPRVGESVNEVTLGKWLKPNNSQVKKDEPICQLESEKTTFDLNAEQGGVLSHKVKSGDVLQIGAVIAVIEVGSSVENQAAATPGSKELVEAKNAAAGHPSPAAAKMMAEKGVSPSELAGTGKGGRITKTDVLRASDYLKVGALDLKTDSQPKPIDAAVTTPVLANVTAPATAAFVPTVAATAPGARNLRREKMSTLRKTIAKKLVAAKNETAMLTTFNEVDMSAIMAARKKYKETFQQKHGTGLGFMSFFAKAVMMAIPYFPAVNATIEGDEFVYHDFVDLGIAVSTDRGLIVPIIPNAHTLSMAGIEKEIQRLATKARDNKITLEEITGGTFTITNGGIFGSMLATPILNHPQVAILGMHNIVDRPVAIAGEVVIRPVMYVALSYDHRIIDGRESVGFLCKIKEFLEDPMRLLLDI